eukprot:3829943-Pyramimonas_sp.AAC.1
MSECNIIARDAKHLAKHKHVSYNARYTVYYFKRVDRASAPAHGKTKQILRTMSSKLHDLQHPNSLVLAKVLLSSLVALPRKGARECVACR